MPSALISRSGRIAESTPDRSLGQGEVTGSRLVQRLESAGGFSPAEAQFPFSAAPADDFSDSTMVRV